MPNPDDEMLTWLRATIEGSKAAAEAATKGEWGSDDGGSIHVDHPTHVVVDWIVNDEDLAHVLLQQPQDTIARCESEMRILDDVVPMIESMESAIYGEWGSNEDAVDALLRTLASGYRRRPGWNPDWAPEGITP